MTDSLRISHIAVPLVWLVIPVGMVALFVTISMDAYSKIEGWRIASSAPGITELLPFVASHVAVAVGVVVITLKALNSKLVFLSGDTIRLVSPLRSMFINVGEISDVKWIMRTAQREVAIELTRNSIFGRDIRFMPRSAEAVESLQVAAGLSPNKALERSRDG